MILTFLTTRKIRKKTLNRERCHCMNHLKDIVEKLNNSQNVLLFPHINMDGDALGSSIALCKGLRMLGKECYILLDDEIPKYLAFLDKGYCVNKALIFPDTCVAIDCGDISRIENRKDIFFSAKTTICIDPVSYTHL